MRVDPRSCTLLKGVVGSTAYGLNHANSDLDYLGMFAVPTVKLFDMDAPNLDQAIEFKNPDTKFYEAGKYVKLALNCNPSILELLWLEHYNVRTSYGNDLIALRNAFPSRKAVRNAYMGYATQQLSRLDRNQDFDRRAKNARHFARLLWQGRVLYQTGELVVRLPNPEFFIEFGKSIAGGDTEKAKDAVAQASVAFDGPSALPEYPNKKLVNEWLIGVRHGLYIRTDSNLDSNME